MKQFIILVISSVMFVACETLVTDVDLPETSPKLVVYATLCPQEPFTYVYLNFSVPQFGDQPNYSLLPTALVVISGANQSVTCELTGSNYYSSDGAFFFTDTNHLKIIPGEEYTIQINLSNGLKTKATCRVPSIAPQNLGIVDLTRKNNEIRCRIKLNDEAGKRNYYRVYYFNKNLDWDNHFSKNDFFTDISEGNNADGKTIYSNLIKIPTNYFVFDSTCNIRVLSVDENYYKYHTSYTTESGGFFTEPSIMFSNIENGLGYFGAVNYNDITIQLIR